MLNVIMTTQNEAERLYAKLWRQGYRVSVQTVPDSDGDPLYIVSVPRGAEAYLNAA